MARTKKNKPGAKLRAAEKAKKEGDHGSSTGPKVNGEIHHVKRQIAPQNFYGDFVKKRQPVVLHHGLDDLKFVTENWANVDYLRKTAGEAKVKVEPMHKEKGRYGTDVERIDTTFGAFLDSLEESKDEYDYLTTQYSDDDDDDDDEDEESGAFPEPVRTLLRKVVPMRPALMGNLVLQQMNLWLGKSKSGASSGLHHDFHDNLYVLLKGRKRFVLYPPAAVEHLRTYGEPKKVHRNGLIVYKRPFEDEVEGEDEGEEIRADGLVQRAATALKIQALEEKIAASKKTGKTKGLDKLKKQHEEAINQMKKYEIDDYDESNDEDDDEDEGLEDQVLRDHVPSKKRKAGEELGTKASKATKADHDDSDEDGLAFADNGDEDDDSDADLLEALEKAQNGQADDEDDDDDESDADLLEALEKAQNGEADDESDIDLLEALSEANKTKQTPSEPLSFSQIPTQELHQHLGLSSPQQKSSALEKAGTPYIVELKAGDMLYLPTSWFHEVTSFSDGKGDDDDVHIALNYWFHPPDSALQKFEDPYEDSLLWRFMQEKVGAVYEKVVVGNED